MNQNKKIIISLGIIFSVVLLSISLLKISINILYPVNELSDSLKDSFKDIFGKAIKFDSLYFKYNGDIVLQNFYLSNKDDFNDNVNLIKCQEITIDTYLFDLIRKKITFAGVYMVEPEVSVLKNYGKTYYDVFVEDIIGGISRDKIREFIKDGFRFELTDSSLNFRETFKNTKSEVDLYNFDLKIKYKNDLITYRSYGYIRDKIRNSWFKSNYRILGKIFLNKAHSEAEIELENFDLSHLDNILNEKFSLRTLLAGCFTGKLNYVNENDIIKCKGSAELSSLNLFYYVKENPYPFFKDEKLNTEFSFQLSKTLDKLTIDKLKIDDGTFKLSSTLDYSQNDFFAIQLNSNKIDLGDLSENIYFFKNCRYNGEFSINGSCRYSLKDKKPENVMFNVFINKFNIIPVKENISDFTNIKNGYLSLNADKEKLDITTSFLSGNSDLNISYKSLITNWSPLKTSNNIEISSKKIELDLLREIVESTIKKVYSLAYVDMFQNFDEQRNFLKEPEGIFINNNDISLRIYSEKLLLSGNSYLNNLNIDLSLVKGVVKTNKFLLDGYDGLYNFNLYSSLNQDYPFFKFSFEAKDLNLDRISYDSGLTYSFGGKLSFDVSFETSAYRIGQVVENGKADLNLTIKDGYVNNAPLQNKFDSFMKQNNYYNIFDKRLDFSNFSISFKQSANNYYIRNFNMAGTNFSFNSYGTYTDDEGLKIPLNLNVIKENKSERVPLEITGKLEAPCVRFKANDQAEPFCFNY